MGDKPRPRLWGGRSCGIASVCVAALLVGGCVSSMNMVSGDAFGQAWVGRDVTELKAGPASVYGGDKPNAKGHYTYKMTFGTYESYSTTSDSYVRAVGPNMFEQVTETGTQYNPGGLQCTIYLLSDAANRIITDYSAQGNCSIDRYYLPKSTGLRGPGDELIRRL